MINGKCLCGSVEIELANVPKTFCACHCLSCRAWTGGVFMSINPGKEYKIHGEQFIGRYSSSPWAERGFCKECGSNVFYRMKKSDHYFFMLGLFGDQISPVLEEQQFIDQKPASYNFSEKTKLVTKAEMNRMLDDYLAKDESLFKL